MHQIAFLAQDSDMFHTAEDLLHEHHPDVFIAQTSSSIDLHYIKDLIANGTEVIITRGGMRTAIQKAELDITVVEIPITASDTMQAIKKAQKFGDTIGIISYPAFVRDMETMMELFEYPLDLRIYSCASEADADINTQKALSDGCNAIVCGCMGQKFAKKYNLPFEFVPNGRVGISSAVEEAKRIVHARNLEKVHTAKFRTVLNYAYEGIISIDEEYTIISCNPQAGKILGLSADSMLHKKINSIFPTMKLSAVLQQKKEQIGEIFSFQGVDILYSMAPLQVNQKITGAVITLQAIAQIQQLESHVRRHLYDAGHTTRFSFKNIEAANPDLQQTIHIAKQFALTNSSILIMGETGTGKEVFAQSIHSYSPCHKGPFIAINCAALPVQILESELFGYIGGAFTGASAKGKPGLFELAHNGTIFLDEIAEMEYSTQGKLLRVLQEKTVRRLGSDKILPIQVRVIAATNRNLKKMIAENQFRSDLYYRLNVLQLQLPPLRKRPNDIASLAAAFLEESAGFVKHRLKLTKSALRVLKKHTWPGNVRELKNLTERILAVHQQESIDADIIELLLQDNLDPTDDIFTVLDKTESTRIQATLLQTHGNRTKAAAALGISRATLWRKMKQLENI